MFIPNILKQNKQNKIYSNIIKRNNTMSAIDSITLTFGDCMENHVGMQKIGNMSEKGYSLVDLLKFKKKFNDSGLKTELINLNRFVDIVDAEPAYLLIIKDGVSIACKHNDLYKEQNKLVPDKEYYDTRRQKVLNKLARWNLCFDNVSQKSDFPNGKGTIISYKDVPLTNILKNKINKLTGETNKSLKLEANYYYNINKTGIGFHGDTERKKVIGVRLGKPNVLVFKWYHDTEVIGDEFRTVLKSGDMYIMSEKAVGFDWKKRKIPTLRHAAGCDKYTK
jgi:hypothetical protein